jgi:hypothetical protein
LPVKYGVPGNRRVDGSEDFRIDVGVRAPSKDRHGTALGSAEGEAPLKETHRTARRQRRGPNSNGTENRRKPLRSRAK